MPGDLKREWVVNARALHVDGHDTAAATQAARWARKAGVPVVADLDETYPGVEELIENIDYLIASRDFPCRLMDDANLENALSRMQSRTDAADRGDAGTRRRAGMGRQAVAAQRGLLRSRGGYNRRGRYFSRRVYLRVAAGVAAGAAARFFLRGGGDELHGAGARGGIQPVDAIENMMATDGALRNRVRCGRV